VQSAVTFRAAASRRASIEWKAGIGVKQSQQSLPIADPGDTFCAKSKIPKRIERCG